MSAPTVTPYPTQQITAPSPHILIRLTSFNVEHVTVFNVIINYQNYQQNWLVFY